MAPEPHELETQKINLTSFMAADHFRIKVLWEQLLEAIKSEQFNEVHHRAAEFITAVKRHIHSQEQILFPALKQKGVDSDAIRAISLEHRQMEHMLERLKPLTSVQELWTAIQAIEGQEIEPGAFLRSHQSKEDDVLYPLADKTLGLEQARELIARIRTEVDQE